MSDTPAQQTIENGMKISSTGNNFKHSTVHDAFLSVTGDPDGDGEDGPTEVHLRFDGCCGDFAQGWFHIVDLEAAITAAAKAATP